jgi:predicted RNA-binding Zn ribbon-like protein
MASGFGTPSGSRVLDFINTVDWRDDPARREELIPTAARLAAWARHAGYPPHVVSRLNAERQRQRAVALRETLSVLFRALTARRRLPSTALDQLSRWTRDAWRHRALRDENGAPTWRWHTQIDAGDRMLYEIAIEAGELLQSPSRDRIHLCEGEGCGWLFLDTSKAGRRRWCNMSVCGNRVKVRAYRERASLA